MVIILATVAASQLNWNNLSALFPLMSVQLNLSVSQLGIISAAFVLGYGLVQVPAGIVAAKVGLKQTVLSGAILISVFSLMVAFVSNPYEIAAMRAAAGAGMALVYAPGMALAIRYMREGAQSLGVGLYSAVGDFGGIVGLFGWALLGARLGWRSSVIVSGGLGLAFALFILVLLPREEEQGPGFQVRLADLRKVLFSRGLLVVSFALLGIECGWNAVLYFIIFYLEAKLGAGVAISGLVGSLVLIGAILGALLMSRVSERIQGSRLAFFTLGVATAGSLVFISTATLYGAVVGSILEGVLNGFTSTLGFVLARKVVPMARYDALGLAWVSAIAIFGSSWSTVLFSFLVVQTGYPIAWSAASLIGIVFILPVLLIRNWNSPLPASER